MSLASWLSWTFSPSHVRRAQRRHPAATAPRRRHTFQPNLETLEDRVTPSLTTLASFGANGMGARGVIVDSSGNLYGVTSSGGTNSDGSVFELAKGSGAITTLASFNGTNGSNPEFGLMMDSSGNLYGTTDGGGAYGYGTVFELTKVNSTTYSSAITTVASFNGTGGYVPLAAYGVIMDSSGNLFGTTSRGGANTGYDFPYGAGTVFEVAKGSGTVTTLASFNGADGYRPFATVIMDSSGNLYGTTEYGGASGVANGDGTVFELAKVGSTYSSTITTLASFNGADGAWPVGPMVMDGSGNLYGATEDGGSSLDDGTVFEVQEGSGTITTLASFNGTDGDAPEAGVVMDSSGNLYGTTAYGGTDNGSFFEIVQGSGTVTNLASLNGSNGEYMSGVLAIDSSGNLYGATTGGGANGDGTIVELTNGPSFAITGPTAVTAGTTGAFTLTVLNANGSADTAYSGTVQITSSDPKAVLPSNLAISGGTGSFNVTLETAGAQSITATDVNNPSLTGVDTGVAVSPGAASQVVFTQTPGSGTAGQTLGAVQAVLEDAYGNVETGDNSDKVTLTVNTGPSTQLGGTLTETVAAGLATFSNLLLDTSGSYTLAAVAKLAGGGTLGPVVSSAIAVASPVSLSFGNITYNSRTGLYSETLTVTNTTTGTLTGPMSVELTNLPSGVTLTDATGKTNGNPYIDFLTSGKTLKKGASASITLTFTAASLSEISFDPEVVIGL